MLSKDRIIPALDVPGPNEALALARLLAPYVGPNKIGLEMITGIIASVLEEDHQGIDHAREFFRSFGRMLFYDGKFDDIPNTVGSASAILARSIKPALLNVHASCGIEAMMAAVARASESKILAVTLLTSREENDAHVDFGKPAKAIVLGFARNAKLAGVHGIVCSPQELQFLDARPELAGLIKVVPGIRSPKDPADDQKRTLTPREAARNGADYLVIGRPITKASDPCSAAIEIATEISAGLRERFLLGLYGTQNIKFGSFKLKLHEKHPEAPLSPIYVNIRNLPSWMYALAADILHDLIVKEGLPDFDYVMGIPKAGTPIGEALAKAVGKPHLRIEKVEDGAGRHISSNILDPFLPGKRVLVVDDLVTRAETKLEMIKSVEANGLAVVGTVVLVDREQGGTKEIADNGHWIRAATTLSQLLDLFVDLKKISPDKRAEVLAYVKAN